MRTNLTLLQTTRVRGTRPYTKHTAIYRHPYQQQRKCEEVGRLQMRGHLTSSIISRISESKPVAWLSLFDLSQTLTGRIKRGDAKGQESKPALWVNQDSVPYEGSDLHVEILVRISKSSMKCLEGKNIFHESRRDEGGEM